MIEPPASPPLTGDGVTVRPRVLIIDADEDASSSTQRALAEIPWFSCAVESASTFADAVVALRVAEFDVILLDHGLRSRDGIELLEEAFGASLPSTILLLTGAPRHGAEIASCSAAVSRLIERSELDTGAVGRSVRYALERTRLERELRTSRAYFRTAFDALDDHVAILDDTGVIVEVNRAWSAFAATNDYCGANTCRGDNYFEICEAATAQGVTDASAVVAGLRAVLHGEQKAFSYQYACNSASEDRAFRVDAVCMKEGDERRLVVAHHDVTVRVRAEHEQRAREERYRLAGRATKDVLWDWDLRSNEVVWGEMLSNAFGHAISDASETSDWWASQVHPEDITRLQDGLEQLWRGAGETWIEEYRFRRADGSYCDVLDRGYVQRDEKGTAVRMVGSMSDLTEQRNAQAQLRESEERYRLLFNSNPSPLWVAEEGTMRCMSANDAALAQYGYTREEFCKLTAYDIRVPGEWSALDRYAAEPLKGLNRIGGTQHRKKDGEIIDVEVVLHSIDLGDTQCQIVLATNVTERNRIERAAAVAMAQVDLERRRLQATLDIMPVGVFITNIDGAMTHANAEAVKIWGGPLPPAESPTDYHRYQAWFGESVVELGPDDWAASISRVTGAAVPAQLLKIARFDGSVGYVLNSAAPIRDADGVISGTVIINVDVTEREERERERMRLVESLEFERNRLSKIFEQAPAFMGVMRGKNNVFEMVNGELIRLLGKDPIGLSFSDAMPEAAEQGFLALVDMVRETRQSYVGSHAAVVVRPAPGEERKSIVNFVLQPLVEADGSVSGVLVHGVDVTDQVDSADALRQSEAQYRTLVELSPDGILIHVDGVIVFANNSATQILRAQAPAEIIGRWFMDFVHGDDVERVQARMSAITAGVTVPRAAVRWLAIDGAARDMDVSSTGFEFQGRRAIQTIFRDTTDRRQLEEQLRQAQKMEAVGQLAGGVAHDFNNLLTVIKVNVEFMLEGLSRDSETFAEAMDVRDAADRAAALTRQLLAYSRKQILQPRALDCNVVVKDVQPMLSRLIREDIEVKMNLAPRLGSVMADPGQLEQVLLNLAVNARDAMPGGGLLLIETEEVTLSAQWQSDDLAAVVPGRYVMITISDTGTGISQADQQHIFEPFFTTKPVGAGTGLGLSTVHGIVKQSGGHLHVTSAPAQGTTISVYLPVVPGSPRISGNVQAVRDTSGTETILLVEDMDALRMIARRVLSRSGYAVLEARNGREALEISKAHEGGIALVLTDVIMPEMNGVQLVQSLKHVRPDMKVLFMSGYADDEVARHAVIAESAAFIPKPFSPSGLLHVVRETLDGASPGRAAS